MEEEPRTDESESAKEAVSEAQPPSSIETGVTHPDQKYESTVAPEEEEQKMEEVVEDIIKPEIAVELFSNDQVKISGSSKFQKKKSSL